MADKPILQWREKTQSHDQPWSDWCDDVDGMLWFTSPRAQLQVRIKPSFVPGYFRPRGRPEAAVVYYHKEAQFSLGEDDLVRVNVTEVEESE